MTKVTLSNFFTPYGQGYQESAFDLYRIKNDLPLDSESHDRYFATKVPERKNKDYRPRLRNFVIGFPVKTFK